MHDAQQARVRKKKEVHYHAYLNFGESQEWSLEYASK